MPTLLYSPGDTFLHRLHPLSKLVFSLTAAVIIFGGPGVWGCAGVPGLLAGIFLWRAGLAGRALRLAGRLLGPLALVLFVVHGLFNPQNQTVVLRLGVLAVGQEGVLYAALILVRLLSVLMASLVLVMSTHPAHLVQALETIGLPSGLAYLLGSPLLLLPQIGGRIGAIQAAQQSRGLETQGNIMQRVKALFPLLAPLVFSALVDVEERALALEVRGFSAPNPKTRLNELPDTKLQEGMRWALLLLAVVMLLAGVWSKLYGAD
jgi:energy-coupling factor transport system permease protein